MAFTPACDFLSQVVRPRKRIAGEIVGASTRVGHRLRGGPFPIPLRRLKTNVVIVGGGVSGLAAARKLKKSGVTDFRLLELEAEIGGNARSGKNEVTAYPWGAHYLPTPERTQRELCSFLEEAGVITGRDQKGEPIFEERFLCFSPQERLYVNGRWQDDLWPPDGALPEDIRQYEEMKSVMKKFKNMRGRDGKPAFTIPVDESSQDPTLRNLDDMSMAYYLEKQRWDSPRLRWYMEYACRDDFGCNLENTSAWAGIHYWASRKGSFEAGEDVVLTWPEGNGFLIKKLSADMENNVTTGCLVYDVETDQKKCTVRYLDVMSDESVEIESNAVILACPQFVGEKLFKPWRKKPPKCLKAFTYAPWVVANLWMDQSPASRGAPLAWDNVIYKSSSLGYVVATHQNMNRQQTQSVWTYYLPFTEGDPRQQRRWVLDRTWDDWKKMILEDLRKSHPTIEDHIVRMDVMRWGHAMVRPTPGFIWGKARREAQKSFGRVAFAHSDLSGISIFEEAFHQGIKAVDRIKPWI